jgi:hypothetical protein
MVERQLPQIDFSTFIVSLGTSAQIQLGLLEDPASGKTQTDFAAAQHTIDILEMLEQKTQGNLAKEEGDLLRHMLYELRVAFVERRQAKK